MQQYLETKEQYKDCVLFYRLGDFYEMFFDDAVMVSEELQLTLTGKSCGMAERAPMCGVPYHAADTYIAKLIENGHKVAVCEQVEDPALAKGLVKREVVRIITPGTIVDRELFRDESNNYLASVYEENGETGLAYCDISTGELVAEIFRSDRMTDDILDELIRIDVREVIINDAAGVDMIAQIKELGDVYTSILDKSYFGYDHSEKQICRQFNVRSSAGLGISQESSMINALGGLLTYLFETQRSSLEQITDITIKDNSGFCIIDKTALRNLELLETLFEKKKEGSLLGVLDSTRTAMGARLLRKWIREPLIDVRQIDLRLEAVEEMTDDFLLRNDMREELRKVYDLERLGGRIAGGGANARDLLALKNSLAPLPDIKAALEGCGAARMRYISDSIDTMEEAFGLIDRAITDEPPVSVKEGGIIRPGYSEELDKITAGSRDSLNWIARLEEVERERTGIRKLKLGFNKVFGYYLDVPKSAADRVPDDYMRKQTLVNSERYITEELKTMETIVLNAESTINGMQYRIFNELREELKKYLPSLKRTAAVLAELDVLSSFAETGSRNGYVRPLVDESDRIDIRAGRHPVIEQNMDDEQFISNDLHIDRSGMSMLLITGPNMSGKSTYMRQAALIVLMAQIGSFVPADSAEIGVVDRIFTRIGASDNLARGQSTFYVEMSELACILNAATPRSLIILDEIGRGTSTYDGLSIAWAVVGYLCEEQRMIRTLFATHYHELIELEGKVGGLKNLNVAVSETDGNVVFLHSIEEGGASRSYGIHVARIAGVPEKVLEKAQLMLDDLESRERRVGDRYEELPAVAGMREEAEAVQEEQLTFIQLKEHPAVEMIRELDLMNITPSGAIAVLEKLKESIKEL